MELIRSQNKHFKPSSFKFKSLMLSIQPIDQFKRNQAE